MAIFLTCEFEGENASSRHFSNPGICYQTSSEILAFKQLLMNFVYDPMPRGYRKSLRTTTTTTTSLALSSSAPFRTYTNAPERGKGQRSARAGGGCPPHLTRRRPLEAIARFRLLAHLFTVVGVGPPCGRAAGWFVFGGASRSVLLLLTLHRAGDTNGRREGGKRKYEGKQKRATSGQGTMLQKERERK